MQPARLGQQPTLVNTQEPIKLRRACYVTVVGQRAAAASQLAVIDLLRAVAPTDLRSRQQKSGPICTHCHYFRNDDSYRHKTQHMSCHALTRLCAKFGHRTTRRLGGARPQNRLSRCREALWSVVEHLPWVKRCPGGVGQ